ncbi:MAG: hypothetical protein PWQ43_466 [Rikenellaceae bacterium]|jgi:hypothetical protein|nr:hypothetical protein [Rikenellaceae bacterium]MDI3544817.1 hypothetical protein [Rikenellaceae bacterium]MDN5355524.1 hypothetical protein [Rikenellaceae bacterium]
MKYKSLIYCIFGLMIFTSCVRFTFSGASIPEGAKTFSVNYFVNNASLVNPSLSQLITDKLRDRIQSQTSLIMVNDNADLTFEGEIINYVVQPAALQANDVASLNQLTITINVKYSNKIDEKQSFSQQFSRYQQFSSTVSFSSVESSLTEQIVNDLVDDIFNRAFINW